jgi:2-phosphosulfolactate phosphatase
MPTIETCLSPLLFSARQTRDNYIVVVIDVLRATTAFCAAFDRGFCSIIPVAGLDETLKYKKQSYLVAAERDGDKLDFADFGNSPTGFLSADQIDTDLVFSTTNGTQAIEMGKVAGELITASFSNLSAAVNWIERKNKNVVLMCAGWKNTFSLEDTICAGAIADKLVAGGKYSPFDDATLAARELWTNSRENLQSFVCQSSHYKRLMSKGLFNDLEYCFRIDTSKSLPVLVDVKLVNDKT